MIKGFSLLCIKCYENRSDPLQTHIHNEYGLLTFKCFNCGHVSDFNIDTRNMPDEKQRELIKEKIKITEELEEKELKN